MVWSFGSIGVFRWIFQFEKAAIEVPFETYEIPRAIPKQPWYLNPFFSILIGGNFPFVAVLVEFPVIQTFMLMNRFSYVFAFLLVVFMIMMIMCAEIAVVFQLRSKDYKWWWRAFSNGGSPALYLFVYSVFYLFTGVGILCICDLVLRVRASRVVCFLYGGRRHCLLRLLLVCLDDLPVGFEQRQRADTRHPLYI